MAVDASTLAALAAAEGGGGGVETGSSTVFFKNNALEFLRSLQLSQYSLSGDVRIAYDTPLFTSCVISYFVWRKRNVLKELERPQKCTWILES